MRKLSREYGYSALGVYLLLSAVDFPFCFLAVRVLGTDRIGHWEDVAMETLRKILPLEILTGGGGGGSQQGASEVGAANEEDSTVGPSLQEAERRNKGSNASESSVFLVGILSY